MCIDITLSVINPDLQLPLNPGKLTHSQDLTGLDDFSGRWLDRCGCAAARDRRSNDVTGHFSD